MTGSKYRERRALLIKRQRGRCYYCHESMTAKTATLDHVVPRALGGTSVIANLVAACSRCNVEKGHLTPFEYAFSANRVARRTKIEAEEE